MLPCFRSRSSGTGVGPAGGVPVDVRFGVDPFARGEAPRRVLVRAEPSRVPRGDQDDRPVVGQDREARPQGSGARARSDQRPRPGRGPGARHELLVRRAAGAGDPRRCCGLDLRDPPDLVAVRHHRRRSVDRTGRERAVERTGEGRKRDGDELRAGRRPPVRAVGDDHVGVRVGTGGILVRQDHGRSHAPCSERPDDGPPMHGKIENDLRSRSRRRRIPRRAGSSLLFTQFSSTAPESSTCSPSSPYHVSRGRPGWRVTSRSQCQRRRVGRSAQKGGGVGSGHPGHHLRVPISTPEM